MNWLISLSCPPSTSGLRRRLRRLRQEADRVAEVLLGQLHDPLLHPVAFQAVPAPERRAAHPAPVRSATVSIRRRRYAGSTRVGCRRARRGKAGCRCRAASSGLTCGRSDDHRLLGLLGLLGRGRGMTTTSNSPSREHAKSPTPCGRATPGCAGRRRRRSASTSAAFTSVPVRAAPRAAAGPDQLAGAGGQAPVIGHVDGHGQVHRHDGRLIRALRRSRSMAAAVIIAAPAASAAPLRSCGSPAGEPCCSWPCCSWPCGSWPSCSAPSALRQASGCQRGARRAPRSWRPAKRCRPNADADQPSGARDLSVVDLRILGKPGDVLVLART